MDAGKEENKIAKITILPRGEESGIQETENTVPVKKNHLNLSLIQWNQWKQESSDYLIFVKRSERRRCKEISIYFTESFN